MKRSAAHVNVVLNASGDARSGDVDELRAQLVALAAHMFSV